MRFPDFSLHSMPRRLAAPASWMAWMALVALPTQASPVPTPAGDDVVIEVLRDSALSPQERQWRQDRTRLQQNPTQLDLALKVAEGAIRLGRQDGDPRRLGQAQAALAPWWSQRQPPADVRLLRATILQSQHHFDQALADLQALTQAEPQRAQAWYTLAAVAQVTGRYPLAQQACSALSRLPVGPAGTLCLMDLQSLQGQARAAQTTLARLALQTPAALQAPLALVRAELAERLGDSTDAAARYAEVMALEPDPYAEGAWADWMLDQGRARDVWERLQHRTRHDGLLLRALEAASALKLPQATALRQTFQARMAAARARGDSIHVREEARFALRTLKQPALALQLARQNWSLQKEPIDARLLLEAARAAGQLDAAEPMLAFCREAGWTDVRLGLSTGGQP